MNLTTFNNNNNVTTMTSREIASVTGKEHRHVLADIEKLNLDYKEMGLPKVGHTLYTHEQNNQQYRQFILDKQQTLDLITGYSRPLRIEINRRWAELEEQVAAPTLPATYLDALKALVHSEEEKVVIQHQLTVAAPKLEYYEQVLDQKELYTISEVAKKNGITAQELNKILLAGGIYDKRSNGKTFKTDFMDKGYGKMITARTGHTQAKLTIKGEVFVTNVAMKSKLAEEILAAREAKKAKTVNRPYKMLNLDQKEARSKHTTNTINSINKLLN